MSGGNPNAAIAHEVGAPGGKRNIADDSAGGDNAGDAIWERERDEAVAILEIANEEIVVVGFRIQCAHAVRKLRGMSFKDALGAFRIDRADFRSGQDDVTRIIHGNPEADRGLPLNAVVDDDDTSFARVIFRRYGDTRDAVERRLEVEDVHGSELDRKDSVCAKLGLSREPGGIREADAEIRVPRRAECEIRSGSHEVG